MFDTKLSPADMDKDCPALKKFSSEYWHRKFSKKKRSIKTTRKLVLEIHRSDIFEKL